MKKKLYVNQIRPGDAVEDVFVVEDKTIAQKKDGAFYMQLRLGDKTGVVPAVVWDRVDRLKERFGSGDFVHVNAKAGNYRNEVQLTVGDVQKLSTHQVAPEDFLPATQKDPEKMLMRLKSLIKTIEDSWLIRLLDAFFSDEDFLRKFSRAPAAKKMHHAYVGGLLEHTLSVALLTDLMAGHYKGIDRDLLVCGAILHDMGKIEEFVYDSRIDYSDMGRLVGHIVSGIKMLEKRIELVEGFPKKTGMLLAHMIASHHGSREFGSPEPPKTLEAVLLHQADNVDAKVTGIRQFMDSADASEPWTPFHRLYETFFYKNTQR